MARQSALGLDDDAGARAYIPSAPRSFSRDYRPADLARSPVLRTLHDEHKARQARMTAVPIDLLPKVVDPVPEPRPQIINLTMIVKGYWGYHHLPSGNGRRPPQEIIDEVSMETGIPVCDIKGESRYGPNVYARHLAMYRIRKACPHLSLNQIGALFGGRDHTTVLSACQKMELRHAGAKP